MISISALCALIIYLFGGYLDSANDQRQKVSSNEQN
jgi:hypothetical protein